jgi:hypothetical protein
LAILIEDEEDEEDAGEAVAMTMLEFEKSEGVGNL